MFKPNELTGGLFKITDVKPVSALGFRITGEAVTLEHCLNACDMGAHLALKRIFLNISVQIFSLETLKTKPDSDIC
jgi:hypothetical protein